MIPFSVKFNSGDQLLGLGLSEEDLETISKKAIIVDLASIGVGLWFRDAAGARQFIQPRNSKILVTLGDNKAAISKLLDVDLPE